MKKNTLYLFLIVIFFSCTSKEKQLIDYKNNLIKEYNDSIETNVNKLLTNTSTLLDIELLSTKSEYNKKIKQLVKSGKLQYINGYLVYKYDFDGDMDAYGVITPYYHKGKLFQLELITKMADRTIDGLTTSLIKASKLNEIYDKKYSKSYKQFYMYDSESSELKVAWVGNGKEILIDGGIVTYTALSEQKLFNAEKEKKSNEQVNDL